MTESFSLFAGWLIDGTGGPIRRNVLVRVKKGTLHAIEDSGEGIRDRGDVVDFSRCTLIPPLVDSHVHLFMSGSGDPEIRRRQLNFTFDLAMDAVSRHIGQHLAHGVLAVRDGGDYGGFVLRYKERFQTAESPIAVRCAGKAWRAPGRYGKLIGEPPGKGRDLAHAILAREERPDHVKIVQSGLNSLKVFGKETPPQFTLEELKGAVRAARRLGLKVMVHANGNLPVKLAIESGCDSIEHGFFMGGENLKRMAERQVVWTPTAVTMKAYSDQLGADAPEAQAAKMTLDHQLEQIRKAAEYGVPIAIGTDAGSLGVHHGSAVKEEIRLLMRAGLSVEKAIQSATSVGAGLLGLGEQLGMLEKGRPAAFLVVRGDPTGLLDALGDGCFRGPCFR